MLLDERYGEPVPEGLTGMPAKADLYAADVDFQEGWEDLVAMADHAATRAVQLASAHSMMLVKPDALVSRRLDTVLDWLSRQGFTVAACMPMAIRPDQVKALWRYQFNSAPRLRKDAYQALFAAAPSILLVVRSVSDGYVPAAQRLASLKGPADPALQRPDDLRACLGNVTHLLSFVHAADEPADLVRELAILLPPAERRTIHARMRDGAEVPVHELHAMAADVCERLPRHTLDMPAALGRIEALADGLMDGADRSTARALCARAGNGGPVDWRALFDVLDRHGIRYDPWDRITVAAHTSDVSNPHLLPLLGTPIPLA